MKFPHPRNQEVLELFGSHRYVTLSGGGNFSSKAFVVSDILDQFDDVKKLVWVVNNKAEQESMARVLGDWIDFDVDIFDAEGGHRALAHTLATLSSSAKERAVVMTYQQILDLYPRRHDIEQNLMTIKTGGEIDPTDVFETLINMEYEVSEDPFLEQGTYLRHGDVIDIFPINSKNPVRIELDFETVSAIYEYKQGEGTQKIKDHKKFTIYPLNVFEKTAHIWEHLGKGTLLIEDELDLSEDLYREVDEILKKRPNDVSYILFTSFLEESDYHFHLHYLSVLKYQNKLDFLENMREKMVEGWRVYLFTKNSKEIKNYFDDRRIHYVDDPNDLEEGRAGVVVF